jgi:hypothetical protein
MKKETFMKRTSPKLVFAGMAVLAVAVAGGIGFARAASPTAAEQANTFGSGGTTRSLHFAPTASAAGLSAVADSVLADANVVRSARLASLGSGDHAAALVAAATATGSTCFTATHAGGKIVEPLNCQSGAYLRVWNDASGDGAPSIANSTSQRVFAVVSQEVASVRISFADGSSRLLLPDSAGAIAIATSGGASRATRLEALGTDGGVLTSANV